MGSCRFLPSCVEHLEPCFMFRPSLKHFVVVLTLQPQVWLETSSHIFTHLAVATRCGRHLWLGSPWATWVFVLPQHVCLQSCRQCHVFFLWVIWWSQLVVSRAMLQWAMQLQKRQNQLWHPLLMQKCPSRRGALVPSGQVWKDDEGCWRMLKDVEGCWRMLKDVEGCWRHGADQSSQKAWGRPKCACYWVHFHKNEIALCKKLLLHLR